MLAAIDAGSNTLRLLIGEVADGKVVPHNYLREITRLAGGFTAEDGLSPEARERTISALQGFALTCQKSKVSQIRAVGTAAFRQAVNGHNFAEAIRTATGIPLDIISGDTEAGYMVDGVLSALDPIPADALLVDIGGGSTEFVLCSQGERLWSVSMPLGVVALTEGCDSQQLRQETINESLKDMIGDLTEACRGLNIDPAGLALVGTAGTVTTLAALDMGMTEYDWRRVNNYSISLSRLVEWHDRLEPMGIEARETLAGMEPGRGDLIPAGLDIILCLMRHLKLTSLVVSDFGLLEGLLLSVSKAVKT
jgi:exopolyphosphatase/guanosine-5'-triphosphate,3'-diphosphate pyrophosphatase